VVDDDRPIGRILTRREVLALLAGSALVAVCAPARVTSPSAATAAPVASATAAAAATVMPSCVVRPALTEGPYFVDEKLNRSDIRSDPSTNAVKPGTPLVLTFLVSNVRGGACTALANATVDVWHCDALGVYSDASDPNFGSTKGTKFLRGYQTTDPSGSAKFTTIWPGWYRGRAVHIHVKVHVSGKVVHTGQLFFDDSFTDTVYASTGLQSTGLDPGVMNGSIIAFRPGTTRPR